MSGRLPLQRWIRWFGIVVTTIVVILILLFSFMPAESAPRVSWIPFADKGAHLIAYAAYGFSSFLATLEIPGSSARRRRRSDSALHISSWAGRSIIISLVTGTILGALVELVQPTFGRSREWADLAADFMGLVVGLAVVQGVAHVVIPQAGGLGTAACLGQLRHEAVAEHLRDPTKPVGFKKTQKIRPVRHHAQRNFERFVTNAPPVGKTRLQTVA